MKLILNVVVPLLRQMDTKRNERATVMPLPFVGKGAPSDGIPNRHAIACLEDGHGMPKHAATAP